MANTLSATLINEIRGTINDVLVDQCTYYTDADYDLNTDDITIDSFRYSYGSLDDVEFDASDARLESCGDGDYFIDRDDAHEVLQHALIRLLQDSEYLTTQSVPSFSSPDFLTTLAHILNQGITAQLGKSYVVLSVEDGAIVNKTLDHSVLASDVAERMTTYFNSNNA